MPSCLLAELLQQVALWHSNLFPSLKLQLSPRLNDPSTVHDNTMPWSLQDLCFAPSETMNDESRNKEVHGFVDQSESKNDSDTQTHSEGGHDVYHFPEGGFRAWLVVSGSAASMFCTFGYLTGFGYVKGVWLEIQLAVLKIYDRIYQQWYAENQLKSYTQSDISWIGSVQIFLTFAGGLVGGPVLDRYGIVVSCIRPRACEFCLPKSMR